MKILKSLIIVCLLLMTTGCLSLEQRKEKKNIEKETTITMSDYLMDNYNIKNVSDVYAKYSTPGDLTESNFTGIVTGKFKYNNKTYKIICVYDEKICYDGLSYELKVMPILLDYIKEYTKENNIDIDIQPSYITMELFGNNYIDENNRGFFNNYDIVNNFDEIKEYYNNSSIKLIYNSSNNIVKGIINLLKKFVLEENIIAIQAITYTDNIIKEYYIYNGPYENYYSNKIWKKDDFIVYWHDEEIVKPDAYKRKEIGNFEIRVINNDSYFDKKIEIYRNKYRLYDSKILEIKNISTDDYSHRIYIVPNINACSSDYSAVVYKEADKYTNYTSGVSFDTNETKKFAIYCTK